MNTLAKKIIITAIFLEPKRAGIEEFVRPFDTSDANVQRN